MSVNKMERVLCCNVLSSEKTDKDNIFRHPLYSYEEAVPWPPENWRLLCCWHCCHPSQKEPIPLPEFYDRQKDIYHVFGFFCSLSCAKAYLLEHSAFSAGDRAMLLHAMAFRFFGYSGHIAVPPAQPRHRLKMFGGDLEVEDFRKEHHFPNIVTSPPLIGTPEVYERCSTAEGDALFKISYNSDSKPKDASSGQQTGLTVSSLQSGRSPLQTHGGLFGNFLSTKKTVPAVNIAREENILPVEERKRVKGTLGEFMKKQSK